MNKKTNLPKKLIIIAGAVVSIMLGLINAPAIITIESNEGATLSLSNGKKDDYKQVGITRVTRLVFNKPANLYLSAELDGKQTLSTVQPKRFMRQSVQLRLSDAVAAKKISEGAVVDAIFSGTNGRGIVYGQDTLVSFSTVDKNQSIDPALVSLPYIKKIIWYDYNNFIYLTSDGVGRFLNGVNQGYTGVGERVVGEVKVQDTNDAGSPLVRDIAKAPDLPLVLLSNTNIFTGDDNASRLNAIDSFDPPVSTTNIFASGTSIFKSTANELSDDEDAPAITPTVKIEEYSYEGKVIRSTQLDDDSDVVNIVKNKGAVYVLTQSSIHIIRGGEVSKESFYFSNPADMALYKGQLVILADDGLWRLGEDGKSFQLINKFVNYGVGLEGSMSVDPNNQIIFGTRPDENENDNSATLSLSF